MESMVGDITPASALTVATPPHSWTQAIDRPAPHQHLRAACVPGGGDEDGMQEARGQLKTYFGYNAFRVGQVLLHAFRVGQVLLHAGVCQLSIFLWMGRSLCPGYPPVKLCKLTKGGQRATPGDGDPRCNEQCGQPGRDGHRLRKVALLPGAGTNGRRA